MYSGIIYKYTSPSGKIYIGQTCNEYRRRKQFLNIKGTYSSPKIDNARKKYKPENFLYEVLYQHKSNNKKELIDILNEKEIFYINEYDSIKIGYNCQPGGLCLIKTEDSIKKATKKISKIVLQYSLNGDFIKEWSSTMEIERVLNIDHTQISGNCLGKTDYCHGYIFKYKTNKIIFKINKVIPQKSKKKCGICQIDLNGNELNRWDTVTKAAKELHICRNHLKEIALGRTEYKGHIYKLI